MIFPSTDFMAWLEINYPKTFKRYKNYLHSGGYGGAYRSVQRLWECWQAARGEL